MPNGTSSPNRTAGVVGLGLIGGSIALALRDLGFVVGGADHDESQVDRALDSGIIDHRGLPADAELTVVATPVDAIPAGVRRALLETAGWVTDTGSVKGPIAEEASHERR